MNVYIGDSIYDLVCVEPQRLIFYLLNTDTKLGLKITKIK